MEEFKQFLDKEFAKVMILIIVVVAFLIVRQVVKFYKK